MSYGLTEGSGCVFALPQGSSGVLESRCIDYLLWSIEHHLRSIEHVIWPQRTFSMGHTTYSADLMFYWPSRSCSMEHITCCMEPRACSMYHIICSMDCATCSMDIAHRACSMDYTAYSMVHGTCCMDHISDVHVQWWEACAKHNLSFKFNKVFIFFGGFPFAICFKFKRLGFGPDGWFCHQQTL